MVKVSITSGSFDEVHYTTGEAAEMLGVTADTVKRYCNQHPQRIKGRKLLGNAGPWCIPKSAIDEYKREESSVGRPKKLRTNTRRAVSRKRRAARS